MIGVNATAGQALRILQISSVSHLGSLARDGNGSTPNAHLALPGATKIDAAVAAILNIMLDAQGNANVSIVAKDGFAFAETGDGDDTISIFASHVGYVSSGKGNDKIAIRTHAMSEAARAYYQLPSPLWAAVQGVSSGEGDDTISIDSHGHVDNISAGNGDDSIVVKTTAAHDDPDYADIGGATRIDAGAGDDAITISATNGMVDVIQAGAGHDTLDIAGRYVGRIFGDDGDDTFRLTGERWVSGVWGGDGNDTIEVTAPTIHTIWGGKGNDRIILNNTANTYSSITLEPGDGHDVVEANSAVMIQRFVGINKQYQMNEATIERVDAATLKITFGDADDSVTIRLTGDMAGKPLAIDFYGSGFAMIRRDDADAPILPRVTHAANPVAFTRHM